MRYGYYFFVDDKLLYLYARKVDYYNNAFEHGIVKLDEKTTIKVYCKKPLRRETLEEIARIILYDKSEDEIKNDIVNYVNRKLRVSPLVVVTKYD